MTPARRWVDDRRLYAILSAVVVHPERDLHSGATRNRDSLQLAEVAARESLSPVERLEIALHPWVGFVIMPLFALANAGVTFSPTDFDRSIMTGIVIGFTVGKPAGILFFAWLAVRLGVAERPPGLAWMALTGGGLLAGIGFTMALFIGQLAFDEQTIASAKLAILLASVCSATAGLALLMRNARRARADR
jgi:NhaA family Na+:H+ antiporter